ncbi:hypothetical protein FACS1894152_0400 [Bacilli bacterium]|nr:hypothetical protein FACS1894152_0400 [Bacilli bacterium]
MVVAPTPRAGGVVGGIGGFVGCVDVTPVPVPIPPTPMFPAPPPPPPLWYEDGEEYGDGENGEEGGVEVDCVLRNGIFGTLFTHMVFFFSPCFHSSSNSVPFTEYVVFPWPWKIDIQLGNTRGRMAKR